MFAAFDVDDETVFATDWNAGATVASKNDDGELEKDDDKFDGTLC
jgi:hypothetical protein